MQPSFVFTISPIMKHLRLATTLLQTSPRPHHLRSHIQALSLPHQKMSSPPFYTKSTPPQKPSLKLSHSPLSLPYPPSPSYHPSVSLPDRFDGAWAETISNHGGGPSLSSPNKNKNVFVSFIAFRSTSPSITSQAWASFTEKCEKLMLMQWEHEASEGADPEDMRRFFKIAWVEDVDVQQVHVDLGLLRE